MANVYILFDLYRLFLHFSFQIFMLILVLISLIDVNHFLVYGMTKISIYMLVTNIMVVRHVDHLFSCELILLIVFSVCK